MTLSKLHDVRVEHTRDGCIGSTKAPRIYYAKGGRSHFHPLSQHDYDLYNKLQWSQPVELWTDTARGETYWWYQNDLYLDTDGHSSDQVQLLLWQRDDERKSKFARLRKELLADSAAEQARRERIPEGVRVSVWRRDEGKCLQCGSQEKLEFDHIIPVAKGGSSTARNIQLLCETCNRKKSDSV